MGPYLFHLGEFEITPCFEERYIVEQQVQSTIYSVVLHNRFQGLAVLQDLLENFRSGEYGFLGKCSLVELSSMRIKSS
jgi:hypothetical protein